MEYRLMQYHTIKWTLPEFDSHVVWSLCLDCDSWKIFGRPSLLFSLSLSFFSSVIFYLAVLPHCTTQVSGNDWDFAFKMIGSYTLDGSFSVAKAFVSQWSCPYCKQDRLWLNQYPQLSMALMPSKHLKSNNYSPSSSYYVPLGVGEVWNVCIQLYPTVLPLHTRQSKV